MKIKKYLINGIILLLLIIMGAVGVLYFVLETHTKKQQNDESTVSLVETGQETQTDEITDVGDEGTENVPEEKFLDIFVSFSTQSGNERVKLFASDDLCYAFVPAFCSLDSLTIEYDETKYKVSIAGKKVLNGTKLEEADIAKDSPMVVSSIAKEMEEETEYTLRFMQSGQLPTMFIETANGTMEYINAEVGNKEPGSMVCLNADGSINCKGDLSKVKSRGKSSFHLPKKSYGIEFIEAENVLGMGEANTWVLQANAYDLSRLRNKLTYDIARELELPYAVESEYADVYFNGEYAGNYLICEHIEVGENRVDITETDAETRDVTGGYLFELSALSRLEEDETFVQTEEDVWIIKAPEEVSKEEYQYVESYLNEVCASVEDAETSDACLEQIDMDSFVTMYIIDAIANEIDANFLSTFYYKNPDKADGKLYAGPAWDYDKSYGNNIHSAVRYYIGFDVYRWGWYEHLVKNNTFVEQLQAKLEEVSPRLEELEKNYFDRMQEYLKDSIAMDDVRWKNNIGYKMVLAAYEDWDQSVSFLAYYFAERVSLLKDIFCGEDEYFHVNMGNNKVWIKSGEAIPEDIINYLAAYNKCAGWTTDKIHPYNIGEPVLENMTLYPLPLAADSGEIIGNYADDEDITEETGEKTMNYLSFILLMMPGMVALFISGHYKVRGMGDLVEVIIRYAIHTFLVVAGSYGTIYLLKGSATFSFSEVYDAALDYTMYHVNVVFEYTMLALFFACVTGIAVRVYERYGLRRKNSCESMK